MKRNFLTGNISSGNEVLTITKGHDCVVNSLKLTRNNPNLDLVNINAYEKLGQIPSNCSQDIERIQIFDNNQFAKMDT